MLVDAGGRQGGAGEGNRTLVVSLGRLRKYPKPAEIRHFLFRTNPDQYGIKGRFPTLCTAPLPHGFELVFGDPDGSQFTPGGPQ